ncbi:hypothetical protein FRC03_003072 [Tulasnella sp. 419]|nr:hypothetical protein FRC03_003072 [Tulasnella sp. 419]
MSKYTDPAYTAFVGLLQRRNDVLPTLQTSSVTNAATHYLSTLPDEYLPSLCHAIVTSPSLWQDPTQSEARLLGFAGVFHSATALKYSSVNTLHGEGILSNRSVRRDMSEWLKQVVDGLSVLNARFDVRLAVFTGLLRGVREQQSLDGVSSRAKIEDQIVLACLEATGEHSSPDWVEQFGIHRISSPHAAPSTLQFLSQALQLLPGRKIRLLDLQGIIKSVLGKYSACFSEGHFLWNLDESLSTNIEGQIVIQKTTPFAAALKKISSDPFYSVIGPSSTLIATCITHLPDAMGGTTSWMVFEELVDTLQTHAATLSEAWSRSKLADVLKEEQLATESREVTTHLWTIFKSVLFSNILMFQSILDLLLFDQPQNHHSIPIPSKILTTLFYLSFITSKLGPGSSAQGGTFVEQRKVFFTALDVLEKDSDAAKHWLEGVSDKVDDKVPSKTVSQSQISFFLISAEQLIPILDEGIVENLVLPKAQPYLLDPSQREMFESAHSFVLSIFSNHSKMEDDWNPENKFTKDKIAGQLAPFYLNCLLTNSSEGGMSTEQLCLAFSSLLNSARHLDLALAQLCIDKVWDKIEAVAAGSNPEQSSSQEQAHKLRLALVSSISAASSRLLPDLLQRLRSTMLDEKDIRRKKELVSAAFKQVSVGAADADREIVMRWWLKLREEMNLADGEAVIRDVEAAAAQSQ